MANNKRSAIYSHYLEDESDAESFICRYCHQLTRSGGGTSNLHKHLSRYHPHVQKYSVFGMEDGMARHYAAHRMGLINKIIFPCISVSTLDGSSIQYHEVADEEEYQETLTMNGTEDPIIDSAAKRVIKVRAGTPAKAKKVNVSSHSRVVAATPEDDPVDESPATKPTRKNKRTLVKSVILLICCSVSLQRSLPRGFFAG